ncbi:MAG: hypothetical protein JKY27_06160 [Magnetovibrio sp.]|nr:hypothetical protein [Magnetovibrio sp.]
MEIGANGIYAGYGVAKSGAGGCVGCQSEKTTTESGAGSKIPEEKSLIAEIREKGFGTYVEELEERKKEELRDKLLGEMGLSEEQLAQMSPDARAAIEKAIAEAIRKRMSAASELSKEQEAPKGQDGQFSLHNAAEVPLGQPTMAQIDDAGVGLGPLLALQEIDRQAEARDGGGKQGYTGMWGEKDNREAVAG